MKISKKHLIKVIKEELYRALHESGFAGGLSEKDYELASKYFEAAKANKGTKLELQYLKDVQTIFKKAPGLAGLLKAKEQELKDYEPNPRDVFSDEALDQIRSPKSTTNYSETPESKGKDLFGDLYPGTGR